MALEPGLAGAVELVVGEADTALAMGSGDVATLGTPRVVALVEAACVRAVAGAIADRSTTVGTRVELSHLLPVPVGGAVKAEATLERVQGKRLTFTVNVSSDRGLVAAGKLTRALVDRQRFVEKAG